MGSGGTAIGGSGPFRPSWMVALYVPVLLFAVCWIVVRDGWPGAIESVLGGAVFLSLVSGVLLGAGVSVILHGSPVARTRSFRRMRRVFRGLLPGLRPADAWMLAIASGVAEEALFRGALLPAIGLLPSSLVFGVLHIPPDRRLIGWPVFAALLGLAFGGLVLLTGGLLGPMAAHVTVNLVGLRRFVPRKGPSRSI